MNKSKKYSKSYLPSALYRWSFLLMMIVIIIFQSCASTHFKAFYSANESLVYLDKFQQGEKVLIIVSDNLKGPKKKSRLIGYRKEYGVTKSTWLVEKERSETYFYIIIKNHATGEEYEASSHNTSGFSFSTSSYGKGETWAKQVYTDEPGLYSATLKWSTRSFMETSELQQKTIQFEVTPKVSANLSKIEASKQTFDSKNILTFFDNNIRNNKIKSWLKNLSADINRGWTSCRINDRGLTLYHKVEGDISSIILSEKFKGIIPYGLSFSQTRREIETIIGKSKKVKLDESWKRYPSKRIMIRYKKASQDDFDVTPYMIWISKEGFKNL